MDAKLRTNVNNSGAPKRSWCMPLFEIISKDIVQSGSKTEGNEANSAGTYFKKSGAATTHFYPAIS